MVSLLAFMRKHDYLVSSYQGHSGETEFVFTGINRKDSGIEHFAFLPGGYPGEALLSSLLKDVSVISFIGSADVAAWTDALARHFPHMEITEDRDNADYLYKKEDMITLEGRQLHKKLALLQKFEAQYPDNFVVDINEAPEQDVYAVLDAWAAGKDVVEDYEAVTFMLETRHEFGLRGILLYAQQGEPVAFTLGEVDGTRIITHVEKAIPTYQGVYQFINRAFAISLPEDIYDINREQDLGIPGLRQAKKTYQPYDFVTKYKVAARQE